MTYVLVDENLLVHFSKICNNLEIPNNPSYTSSLSEKCTEQQSYIQNKGVQHCLLFVQMHQRINYASHREKTGTIHDINISKSIITPPTSGVDGRYTGVSDPPDACCIHHSPARLYTSRNVCRYVYRDGSHRSRLESTRHARFAKSEQTKVEVPTLWFLHAGFWSIAEVSWCRGPRKLVQCLLNSYLTLLGESFRFTGRGGWIVLLAWLAICILVSYHAKILLLGSWRQSKKQ